MPRRKVDRMTRFYVYDTKEKKTVTNGAQYRCNAERTCQAFNIKNEGVEETEKPANERRFIVKEVG